MQCKGYTRIWLRRCERADSQRSIALAQLRELHGHLQPLQELMLGL